MKSNGGALANGVNNSSNTVICIRTPRIKKMGSPNENTSSMDRLQPWGINDGVCPKGSKKSPFTGYGKLPLVRKIALANISQKTA